MILMWNFFLKKLGESLCHFYFSIRVVKNAKTSNFTRFSYVQCNKNDGSSLDDRPWPPDHHISCDEEFLCSGNVRRIGNEEAIPFYRNRLFILQSPHISCGREFLVKGNVMGMKDGEEKNPFQRNF